MVIVVGSGCLFRGWDRAGSARPEDVHLEADAQEVGVASRGIEKLHAPISPSRWTAPLPHRGGRLQLDRSKRKRLVSSQWGVN